MSGQMPGCARGDAGHVAEAARGEAQQCGVLLAVRASATSMSVVAASCGTWLTIATSASWCSGVTASTSAPSERTSPRTVWNASGSVRSVGVSTQVAPDEQVGVGAVEAVLLGAGHRVSTDEARRRVRAGRLDGAATPALHRADVRDQRGAGVERGDDDVGDLAHRHGDDHEVGARDRLVDRARRPRRRRRAASRPSARPGRGRGRATIQPLAAQREPDGAADEARSR